MPRVNLFALIIITLIIGFIGYLVGINWGTPSESQGDKISFPQMAMIPYWSASVQGEVTKISDKTITLSSGEENLVISIEEGTDVIRLVADKESGWAKHQAAQIEEIKVGDQLDVVIVLENGVLSGQTIIILP
jgi:hypothetical protein